MGSICYPILTNTVPPLGNVNLKEAFISSSLYFCGLDVQKYGSAFLLYRGSMHTPACLPSRGRGPSGMYQSGSPLDNVNSGTD